LQGLQQMKCSNDGTQKLWYSNLYCVDFRMLEWNSWHSRVCWNSTRHQNSVWMSRRLCQQQHLRCYRLGAEQCREVMLDSCSSCHQTYYTPRRHHSLRSESYVSRWVVLPCHTIKLLKNTRHIFVRFSLFNAEVIAYHTCEFHRNILSKYKAMVVRIQKCTSLSEQQLKSACK